MWRWIQIPLKSDNILWSKINTTYWVHLAVHFYLYRVVARKGLFFRIRFLPPLFKEFGHALSLGSRRGDPPLPLITSLSLLKGVWKCVCIAYSYPVHALNRCCGDPWNSEPPWKRPGFVSLSIPSSFCNINRNALPHNQTMTEIESLLYGETGNHACDRFIQLKRWSILFLFCAYDADYSCNWRYWLGGSGYSSCLGENQGWWKASQWKLDLPEF